MMTRGQDYAAEVAVDAALGTMVAIMAQGVDELERCERHARWEEAQRSARAFHLRMARGRFQRGLAELTKVHRIPAMP